MKRVLLITGGKIHPFKEIEKIFKNLYGKEFEMQISSKEILSGDKIFNFDGIVIYTDGGRLTEKEESNLLKFVKNGGGIAGIHSATASFKENRKYLEMLGSEFISHGHVCEFTVRPEGVHYINERIPEFSLKDEFYILNTQKNIKVLLSGYWQGKRYPVAYIKSFFKGRVFYISLGHMKESFENKDFQKVIKRGIKWICGEKEVRKTIKCGIIGYGPYFNMGKHHANSINSTYGMKTVAFFDINEERMKEAKKNFPEARTYTDMKNFLQDKEVELVVIITPHNTHKDLAIQSLNAGKHVIVEKPMCLSLKEADEMIETAEKRNLMLTVYHNRRWDGDFLTIEQTVNSGRIGKIFNIETFIGGYSMQREWWRSEKEISGGLFYDWGAHFIYWVLSLIPSRIKNITGFVQKRVWFNVSNEDEVKSIIRFENGEVADVQQSTIAAVKKPRWRILGEKGGIVEDEFLKIYIYEKGNIVEEVIPAGEPEWFRFYWNIADHLLLKEELEIKVEMARKVIGVIEKTIKSAEEGKPLKLE